MWYRCVHTHPSSLSVAFWARRPKVGNNAVQHFNHPSLRAMDQLTILHLMAAPCQDMWDVALL